MSVSIADRLSASREVDVFPNQVGLRYNPRSRRALRDTLLQEAQKSVRFLVRTSPGCVVPEIQFVAPGGGDLLPDAGATH